MADQTSGHTTGQTAERATERPAGRRRTFGPVVLLGLLAGALSAVAGNKTWAVAEGRRASQFSSLALSVDSGKMPVTTALALVVLAAWGVVLVTRRRVRRVVAVIGALAAVGTVVAVVVGWSSTVDSLRTDLAGVGVTDATYAHTGWFWAAAVGSVLSVVATVLAVRLTPAWPEMGSRYDAPGAAAPEPVAPEEQANIDLWKAMDEGRDPTA